MTGSAGQIISFITSEENASAQEEKYSRWTENTICIVGNELACSPLDENINGAPTDTLEGIFKCGACSEMKAGRRAESNYKAKVSKNQH